jgi:outer membrane immunogenic protein
MSNCLLRTTLAAALLGMASTAVFAADLPPPPPPVEDLRPATYDWSGPFVGGLLTGACMDSHYIPSQGPDPELSGCGVMGGVIAGYNFQMDDLVVGIEGDWSWGGKNIAKNSLDLIEYDLDSIATLRGRIGWAMDDTLLYVTGGAAWADGSMTGTYLAPPAPGVPTTETVDKSHMGWTIGGGLEHAFTDSVHFRLEYLYADLGNEDYVFGAGCVCEGLADLDLKIHTVRAAITWNFGSMW